MRRSLFVISVMIAAAWSGCGARESRLSKTEPETTTDATAIDDEPTGVGSMTVTIGDRTEIWPRWEAQFGVIDWPSEDRLEMGFSAHPLDYSDGVGVSISRQLVPGPLSLVGAYDVSWSQSPTYSCVVEVGAKPNRVSTGLPGDRPGQSRGSVTISSHQAGRIRGTLSATLADGRLVTAEFEGEVRGDCSVPIEGSDNAFEMATFEHPFCAQYFQ